MFGVVCTLLAVVLLAYFVIKNYYPPVILLILGLVLLLIGYFMGNAPVSAKTATNFLGFDLAQAFTDLTKSRIAGLGLNICKVLVNLSGGQIRVESQQGEWCRFVFTLPSQAPNPGGMKRLPDEAGGAPAVEDPASMKPVE